MVPLRSNQRRHSMTREERKKHVADYLELGDECSATEYAKDHNINPATFRRWLREFKNGIHDSQVPPEAPPAPVPVFGDELAEEFIESGMTFSAFAGEHYERTGVPVSKLKELYKDYVRRHPEALREPDDGGGIKIGAPVKWKLNPGYRHKKPRRTVIHVAENVRRVTRLGVILEDKYNEILAAHIASGEIVLVD